MAYSIELNDDASCFVRLPPSALVALASHQTRPTLACTLSDGRVVYVTCAGWTAAQRQILVPTQLAHCLQMRRGDLCTLRVADALRSCVSLSACADTHADFRLLQLAAERLAGSWLQRAACVWPGGRLPVWLDGRHCVAVTVQCVEPPDACVLLVNSSRVELLPPNTPPPSSSSASTAIVSSRNKSRLSRAGAPGVDLWSSLSPHAHAVQSVEQGAVMLRVLPLPQRVWRQDAATAFSGAAARRSLLSQKLAVCTAADFATLTAGDNGPAWFWVEKRPGKGGGRADEKQRCSVLLTPAGEPCALPQVADVWACLSADARAVLSAGSDTNANLPADETSSPAAAVAGPTEGRRLILQACQPGAVLLPDIVRRQLCLCVSDTVFVHPMRTSKQSSVSAGVTDSCGSGELGSQRVPLEAAAIALSGKVTCELPMGRASTSQLASIKHQLAGWCRLLCASSYEPSQRIAGGRRLAAGSAALPAHAGVVMNGDRHGWLMEATDEETLTDFDVRLVVGDCTGSSETAATTAENKQTNSAEQDDIDDERMSCGPPVVLRRVDDIRLRAASAGSGVWPCSLRKLNLPAFTAACEDDVDTAAAVDLCPVSEARRDQFLGYLRRSLLPGRSHTPSQLDRCVCVLVTGAGGIGKTCLLRHISRRLARAPLFVYSELVSCRALIGKRVESVIDRLRACVETACERQPSLLLLDDLDHLADSVVVSAGGGGGGDTGDDTRLSAAAMTGRRFCVALSELLTTLARRRRRLVTRVTVVATCSTACPTQLLTLFCQHMELPSPDSERRAALLSQLSGLSAAACGRAAAATASDGFVLRDLCRLVTHARAAAAGRRRRLTDADLTEAAARVVPACRIDVAPVTPAVADAVDGWKEVGGMQQQRRLLVQLVWRPLVFRRLYARVKRWHKSRVLLYGPPGCGKTLLVRALARQLAGQARFFTVKGPELLSKYIGASEAAVRSLFEKAERAAPSVIFFDEFDALATRRGHDSTGVTDRCVNQLLTELDGVSAVSGQVAVLAATSRPELIDPALLRPGRIGRTVWCGAPDSTDERARILQALLDGCTSTASTSSISEATSSLTNHKREGRSTSLRQSNGAEQRTGGVFVEDVCAWRVAEMTAGRRVTAADLAALVTDAHIAAVRQLLESAAIDGATVDQNSASSEAAAALCHSTVVIRQSHLAEALDNLRPSISEAQWRWYDQLYAQFAGQRPQPDDEQRPQVSQRVTLA